MRAKILAATYAAMLLAGCSKPPDAKPFGLFGGMKIDQIQKVVRDLNCSSDGRFCSFDNPPKSATGLINYFAFFGREKQLCSVTAYERFPATVSGKTVLNSFDSLATLLHKKYGAPSFESRSKISKDEPSSTWLQEVHQEKRTVSLTWRPSAGTVSKVPSNLTSLDLGVAPAPRNGITVFVSYRFAQPASCSETSKQADQSAL